MRVQELPGHLGKFNGCWGTIESMEVDAEGRQWIIVKLDDNVRMLPVRCPPMSVSHANKPHEPARGESTQSSSLQWAPLSQVSLHAEFAERGVEALDVQVQMVADSLREKALLRKGFNPDGSGCIYVYI